MILPDSDFAFIDPHTPRLKPLLVADPLAVPKLESYRVLFICFTNRSGSNYLAELLGRTGLYNIAGEFLNFDTVLHQQKVHGFRSLSDYFSFLIKHRSVSNNFSCKVSVTQIAMLYRIGMLQELAPVAKFVMVERADLLKQAISLDIASRTGQWTSYMKAKAEVDESSFDPAKLKRLIEGLAKEQHYMRLFFGINGIEYFQVTYDELTGDTTHLIARLLKWLGHEPVQISTEKMETKKQYGELNDLWRKRYMEFVRSSGQGVGKT